MEKEQFLAKSKLGPEVINSTLSMDSAHQAETEAINEKEKVGSENDKMAKDR